MLALLQLADSCFPAGGFAFSNGLEGLAKGGWLKGLEDFRQYLESYLTQVATADLPFLNSAFEAAPAPKDHPGAAPGAHGEAPLPSAGPLPSAFIEVAWEWDAFLTLPAPRKASLAQGQAWLRAVEGAHAGDAELAGPLAALRPAFRNLDLPAHFLMALAATLRLCGFTLSDAQHLLFHMALRDQLGAAVRLGLVGSLQAAGLHRRFVPLAEAQLKRHASDTHHRSRKTAPMIEMGQAGHPYLYSRLFQS